MRDARARRAIGSARMSSLAGALAMLLLAAGAGPARAHFLWLDCHQEQGKPVVRAFLSETPHPDSAEFLAHIARARITAGGKILGWTRDEDTYRVNLPATCPEVVDGFCDMGLMTRNGSSFRLVYTARMQLAASLDGAAGAPDHLRLRLVARPGQAPGLVVTVGGQPAAGASVKAFPADGEPVELRTDSQGRLEYPPAARGKVGFLAKWIEKTPGTLEGKPYGEVRYYATLTVASSETGPVAAASGPATSGLATATSFATLPQAVDSFGGAVLGDWLYVYGGHAGKTHKYSRETVSKHFRRLNLRDRTTWEDLPAGPPLQGVTLMAHGGRLYRIGGMAPHNEPGQPHDLVSVADFARFDPDSKTWTNLPPLPAPRSTHDSVVVGDRIYVIGGWTMTGGDSAGADFVETALVFDLARPGARWEELPAPPFRRRALAVGAIGGKVYAIGGLTDDGKVTNAVDIYDPATKTWSHGPDLPGSKRQGFAPSAFAVGGALYASGIDGNVLRLSTAGDGWETAGKLATPRLTHRLLPGSAGDLLAVGGSAAGSPLASIESFPVAGVKTPPAARHAD